MPRERTLMDPPEYLVEIRKVTKEFLGVTALREVDFAVRPGTVHAVVGENGAGKSTLMKILCGIYSLDRGDYYFRNARVHALTPARGLGMGVSMIQQELNPIPEMSIAENIFLGREPLTRYGLVDFRRMEADARRLMATLGHDFNPGHKIKSLTVAGMQMVEIVKAISRDAALVIMDEPTSSLADKEIDVLFGQIEMLKRRNISVIYITHKMDEIFRIADEITVMRDGQRVSTGPKTAYNMDRLVTEMVGRELTNVYPKLNADVGDTVLDVKGFGRGRKFLDIDFHVRKGEIVGFSGLIGAGRTELMRAVFGLDKADAGTVTLNGREIVLRHPGDAIHRGIAMASEDRKRDGLVLCRSVRENITLPNIAQVENGPLINKRKEDALVRRMVERLRIKVASVEAAVANLSGGNQQKVVLAKWLSQNLSVIILDEPTRGIDVGAKYEIYTMIGEMARMGLAVVVVSSEIPELLGICDRIYVMSQGRITGEFARADATQEKIMQCALVNFATEEAERN